MSRLTRDRTTEPVLRDQIFRRLRGQENIHFPYLADHEQGWQSYPLDPYSAIICDDHTYPSHVGYRSNLSDMVPRGEESCVVAVQQIVTNRTW